MRTAKHILLLSFCLVAVFHFGYSQQPEKQESYKVFKSRSSRESVEQILLQASQHKLTDPDQALTYLKDALAMSIAQNDGLNEARSYIMIAEINEGILEWSLANENYLKAYQKLLRNDRSREYKQAVDGLARTYLNLKSFVESLRYYSTLRKLSLSSSERIDCELGTSEVHYQMGNYQKALDPLTSIETLQKDISPDQNTRLRNQKAKIYARLNDIEKTQDLYSNSVKSAAGSSVPSPVQQQSVKEATEEISDVLREQNRYDDEIDLRQKSIKFNTESKNFSEVTRDKLAISNSLEAKGETDAAIREAEEAVHLSDTLADARAQASALLTLAGLYDKSGKTQSALTAYRKYGDAVQESERQLEDELNARSDLIRKQKDIEELSKNISIGQQEESLEQAVVFRQQMIIIGLLVIIAIIGVTSYFIYKNARASRIANQLLALKSLRSQMNPHFIFNALNSVNHFISEQDERTANRFLSEFSALMRLVLENSQEDFIPLTREKEILNLYLKLEHYRFRDKFEYEITIDESLNLEAIQVPPMLVQPYIENAIWHGLRYKQEKGHLKLVLSRVNGDLSILLTDDGIGREKSLAIKTQNQKKHVSTGLRNIEERLAIINSVYHLRYRISVTDLTHDGGTRVEILIPLDKTEHLNEGSHN